MKMTFNKPSVRAGFNLRIEVFPNAYLELKIQRKFIIGIWILKRSWGGIAAFSKIYSTKHESHSTVNKYFVTKTRKLNAQMHLENNKLNQIQQLAKPLV